MLRLKFHLLGVLVSLLGLPGIAGEFPGILAEVQGRILDAETREPIACTVRLMDSTGHVTIESEGFQGGFRCPGDFVKRLPAGRVHMRVTRGPEYMAAEREFELRAGEVSTIEVVLKRQVNLRGRGWYSQDHHVHMLHGERSVAVTFGQIALAARAEGLQALSIAQAWALERPTPEALDGAVGPHSAPDCLLTWNLEAPKNYYLGDAGRCLGHCWNLGMRGRTPNGDDVIADLLEASAWDYESRKPSYANFESHALIRSQGGAIFYTHPARWWRGTWGGSGGYPKREGMRISNMAVELPLDTLAGPTFDGLDVITGSHELEADEKAFRLWAMLLNQGYRLTATASSDACFDRPDGANPGAARLYTFLDEPFSMAASARAAIRGRTFATTGPLLVVTVDGRPPGSAFPADGREYTLRVEAWPSEGATGRLVRVDVYRNGEVLREFPMDGTKTFPWTRDVKVAPTESAWYCVRASGSDPRRDRAVSGAFYFNATPWKSPPIVPAVIRARIIAADTGLPVDAVLTEIHYLGTRPALGNQRSAIGGTAVVSIPATARLRAEAKGYRAVTLSPFFDHPDLLKDITTLDDQSLLEWQTFERVRKLLGDVPLTFRLSPDPRP